MTKEGQRNDPRVPVELVVDYQDSEDLIGDVTANLSIGGTFVISDRSDLEEGSEVALKLSFPGLIRPLRLAGVVRWCQARGEDSRGLGVEFVGLDAAAIATIQVELKAIQDHDSSLVAHPVRVLLVEDNQHVAELIRQGLGVLAAQFDESLLFLFRTADNGRDGYDLIERFQPDLMIVDLQLPILDGVSVIQKARAAGVETSIVAISGDGDEGRDAALGAGADIFLHKPIRLRTLGKALTSLATITKHSAEREPLDRS